MAGNLPKLSKKALDFARKRLKQSRVPALLGFHVERLARGRAVLSMQVKDLHKQIHDVVHGGVIAALADTAAAIAVYTVIPQGAEIATVELKINYLSPVPSGKIRAIGTVLRAGRNFVVTECEVIDAKRNLAAKALLTFGAVSGTSLELPRVPAKS
ncbi:MAG TPA: PaaI family thioesterase [Candidatus Dormibacteraeota bacterium]|nr:PaaI family thioesterase [Candidatus Dormibacteraeota bacterium]